MKTPLRTCRFSNIVLSELFFRTARFSSDIGVGGEGRVAECYIKHNYIYTLSSRLSADVC